MPDAAWILQQVADESVMVDSDSIHVQFEAARAGIGAVYLRPPVFAAHCPLTHTTLEGGQQTSGHLLDGRQPRWAYHASACALFTMSSDEKPPQPLQWHVQPTGTQSDAEAQAFIPVGAGVGLLAPSWVANVESVRGS